MPASWEPKVTAIEEAKQISTMQMDELIRNLQTYERKNIDKVVEESKKERSLSLKIKLESNDEEMAMFCRRFKKFFRKENLEKRESCNKGKSSEKGQFHGVSSVEEQRKTSKRQQQLASKAFKKSMKATWGETFDEELEGEDGENDNLALMDKSNTDSDNDSSEELENSGRTIPETMVKSVEGTEEGTSPDFVPETQNDSP
ncbi:hypothetical protein HAX54_036968 [Datura stramonium]|uniref:Uncharacterized protein n=1 Tax=Datura stramonium TaxID=4076 RepID=A0ABS8SGU0_DATST|nr:hypothetical protein [Datura stramonium]